MNRTMSGPRGLIIGRDRNAGKWKTSAGSRGRDGLGRWAATMKSLAAKEKAGGKTEDKKNTRDVDLFPVVPSTARPTRTGPTASTWCRRRTRTSRCAATPSSTCPSGRGGRGRRSGRRGTGRRTTSSCAGEPAGPRHGKASSRASAGAKEARRRAGGAPAREGDAREDRRGERDGAGPGHQPGR